ncbi:MAG: thioredoxin family protein [Bryobacteraceae bacterium]
METPDPASEIIELMLPRLLLASCLAATLYGERAPDFPPFDSWRRAVISGDEKALAELYSHRPPARILRGKTELSDLTDECRYWTSLKAAGLSSVNPKLLSLKMGDGKAELVIRIDAKAGDKNVVGPVAQLWVQQLDGWHIAISQTSGFGVESARTLPESAKPNPTLYPPPYRAQSDLRAALATAGREHKRVLVVFGANWCYDCHVLDATFRSPGFATLVNQNYVVLHINIGDEGKDNNDLAQKFGVGLDRGVPNLAVLDPDGRTLVAQRGEFEATTRIGPSDVRAFLEKWKPKRAAVHEIAPGDDE